LTLGGGYRKTERAKHDESLRIGDGKKSGVTYTGFRDEQNFIRGLRWQAINVTYFGGLMLQEYVHKYQ